MAKIESSLGKTSIQSNTSRQLFEIPDLDHNSGPTVDFNKSIPNGAVKLTAEQFNELQERKQQILSVQKKISPEVKAIIEALVGTGRLEKEVKIGNYKFTLQTLKAKEMREVIKAVSLMEGSDQIYEQRTQTLARALIKINDYEVNLVLNSESISDVANFIENLEEIVVAQLFDVYVEMTKTMKKSLIVPETLMEDLKK